MLQFIGYSSSLWYGTQVIDVATGRLWVTTVAEVANCLVWACMLLFVASFPRPWPVLRRRPWLVAGGFALPFLAYRRRGRGDAARIGRPAAVLVARVGIGARPPHSSRCWCWRRSW
nr:hypothetical protein GCM10020092_078050 [Actinoplanes digitatis]